jgi:uncharacterized membrane protein
MGETTKPAAKSNMNMNMTGMILALIGIILLILGVCEFVIKGFPGRGSGIGTVMLILGVLLLIFVVFRMSRQSK